MRAGTDQVQPLDILAAVVRAEKRGLRQARLNAKIIADHAVVR